MTSVHTILAYCNTSTAIQASRYSPHEVLPLLHSSHAVLSLRHSPHAVLSLRYSPHEVLSLRHSSHEVLPFRHQTVLCRCHAPGHAGLTLQLLSRPFYRLAPGSAVMNSRYQSIHFTHPGIRPMQALPSGISQCGYELPASSIHFTHLGIRPIKACQSVIRPRGYELSAYGQCRHGSRPCTLHILA